MTIKVYDLVGRDDLRFSPYCWRTRLALAHKDLEAEFIPTKFTEKEKIKFSGQGAVPVLVNGDEVISDSWNIANYLEDTYPDAPSLFDGQGGRAATFFINKWTDATLLRGGLFLLIAWDLWSNHIHPDDQSYFRETREKRLKRGLETIQDTRDDYLPTFRKNLQPLRDVVSERPFLGGDSPKYADMIVFGTFLWAKFTSPYKALEADDPVYQWRERMEEAFQDTVTFQQGYAYQA